MSEYQYYEFLAVDRALDGSDRQALRALSTRARITAMQFINSYQWGDFKGDPVALMERWFDLHLYFANWGTRRLMLRVPGRFVDISRLNSVIGGLEGIAVHSAGANLIIDIVNEDEDRSCDDWVDDDPGEGSPLTALAPLRAELIAGDLRLFYVMWLEAVQNDAVATDVPEPLVWIGPLTASLEALAEFFHVDIHLVRAAAESGAPDFEEPATRKVEKEIAELSDDAKNDLLVRLLNKKPHVEVELRRLLDSRRQPAIASRPQPRTAGDLLAQAEARRVDWEREQAEASVVQLKRKAEEAKKQQRIRIEALAKQGVAVWQEIETEIDRRNAPGYAAAVELLSDLKVLAAQRGQAPDFDEHLMAIRGRHFTKRKFIERLAAAGL